MGDSKSRVPKGFSTYPGSDDPVVREWFAQVLLGIGDRIDDVAGKVGKLEDRLDEAELEQLRTARMSSETDLRLQEQLATIVAKIGGEAGKAAADASGKKWAALATIASLAIGAMQHCQPVVATPPSRDGPAVEAPGPRR